MKKVKTIISILSILVIGSMLMASCSSKGANQTNSNAQGTTSSVQNTTQSSNSDKDGDGIPDSAEKILGTNPYTPDTDGDGQNDKVDKNPNFADNPIKETSTNNLPIVIKDARVEDNATADHLEITMTNTGSQELNNFDIYYTITDKTDNKQEAYYQKLDNFSIKPNESKTIHFDNQNADNHYFGNMNGLYGTSKNELIFSVELHSQNYKPLNFDVKKSKGTAEVAD